MLSSDSLRGIVVNKRERVETENFFFSQPINAEGTLSVDLRVQAVYEQACLPHYPGFRYLGLSTSSALFHG